MSIIRSALILAVVAIACVSARSTGRHHRQEHGRHQFQHGRAAIAAAAEPHHDEIKKGLEKAEEHADALKHPEELSHKEIEKHTEKIEKGLVKAAANAVAHPGAVVNAAKLAKEKSEGHQEALAHHIDEAAKHEEVLKKDAEILPIKEAVKEHEALQHHVGLALFHTNALKVAAHDAKDAADGKTQGTLPLPTVKPKKA